MQFAKLDDSPMFRKQIQCMEESAESLRERSLRFEGLGEGYDGDISFASALETFGGGHNGSISVACGGPVMTKFTLALREIGTCKEVLRSQVETELNDRLLLSVNIDLLEVKAREKFLSLRKSLKSNVANVLKEYAEKLFVCKSKDNPHPCSVAQRIWEGVHANDKKAVYHFIVNCEADVNAVYEHSSVSSLTLAKVLLLQEHVNVNKNSSYITGDSSVGSSARSFNLTGNIEGQNMDTLDGCTLLHLACVTADICMLELLLQYEANINAMDSRGQTPLHQCILKGKVALAKLLLTRPRGVKQGR